MSHHQADAVVTVRDAARPGLPRRVLQFLVMGPGEAAHPAARWAVNILAVAGAVLLIWSGVIHLHLWAEGYEDIPTIGPLFLAQGSGSLVVALATGILRRLVLMAAGAAVLVGTAVGLLLSAHIGLFGYRESLAVPYAESSLVVEFTGAAVLVVAAAIVLVAHVLRPAPHGRQGPPSAPGFRP